MTPRYPVAAADGRGSQSASISIWVMVLVAHCHLDLGKLYRRTGKEAEARDHVSTATTMYREMGMTYWLEKAEAELTD